MLLNKSLAGKKVATEFGTITFNDKGESKDLTAEQEKKFAKLPGFSTDREVKAQQAKAQKDEANEEKEKAPAKTPAKAKAAPKGKVAAKTEKAEDTPESEKK
jgi:hypothetical protein